MVSLSRWAGQLQGCRLLTWRRMQGMCNSDPDQRSVTIMITDACPECGADHIDVQALTFLKVQAPLHLGA